MYYRGSDYRDFTVYNRYCIVSKYLNFLRIYYVALLVIELFILIFWQIAMREIVLDSCLVFLWFLILHALKLKT